MGVYLADDNFSGFAFDGVGSWTQFGSMPPRPGYSDLSSLRALAAAPDQDNHVYAAANAGAGPGNTVYPSADAGATWVARDVPLIPVTTGGGPIRFLECRVAGEVYLCSRVPSDGVAPLRIQRSLDNGVTWTSIFGTTVDDMGFIALGSTTLWFAHRTASTGPVAYRQINLDGSGLVTRATQSVFPSGTPPAVHLVAAIDDTFALFVSWEGACVYRITATGTLTDIRPSALVKPWDVAIIDSTTYVVVGQSGISTDPMYVYRTTNSGSTWSLVLSVPATDSFLNSFAQHDNARIVEAQGSTIWLLGPDNNRQQMIYRSSDAGVTWSTIANPLATLVGGGGGSWSTSQNGLRAGRRTITGMPSRLAMVIG